MTLSVVLNWSDAFDEWWSREGQYLDPDTSDVPWFDKRRGLAQIAFNAAMTQSTPSNSHSQTDASLPSKTTERLALAR